MHELFEHKADVGIRGTGKNKEEAFAECAKAMFSTMVDLKTLDSEEIVDIEIETNGTIMPSGEIAEHCQLNISPKLDNSGNSHKRRFKPDVLMYANGLEKTTFKFVVTEPDDLVEIQEIIDECQLDSTKVIIMPEGQTEQEIREHALAVVDHVKKRGWRLLPRLQVTLWGNQRKV